MRGCLRYGLILLLVLLFGALGALLVLTAQTQGLIPWLNAPYQNTATVVLDSVQDMSVLTTTRYNYTSVVTSEREMPPLLAGLYGERQVLIAVGHVTAGADLSGLTANDVFVSNGALTVNLPAPALQDCFLNETASYVAERDTGIFNRAAPELDTQARRFAVDQFRDQALAGGILDDARVQAQMAISAFVQALNLPGVTAIQVNVAPPTPDVPLPASCV